MKTLGALVLAIQLAAIADAAIAAPSRRGKAGASTAPASRPTFVLDERFRAGDAKAPVVLVLYACPRNPVCADLIPALHREITEGRLKGKAALHYRPFFPPDDEDATACGRALYAAAHQGQFWPYLLHLCLERESIKTSTLRDWVGRHGLDRCVFDHTCEQPATASWLAASREEAVVNGVVGAPAAFIDGQRVTERLSLETLVTLLVREYERVAGPRR